jgi:hypothetical protein
MRVFFYFLIKGKNVLTNEKVAIKLEPLNAKMPQLLYESKIYKILNNSGNGKLFSFY